MTPIEANVLLTAAALLDPRMKRVDPHEQADMATAWAGVLADVSLADALRVLPEHYRVSTDRLMPGNVWALVQAETGGVPKLAPRDAWLLSQGLDPEHFTKLLEQGMTERQAYQLVRHEPKGVTK